MSEGGAAARRTPYELVFVDGGHEAEAFPALVEEAQSHGIEESVPERLLLLESAGRLLRALRPESEDVLGGRGEYGALLFHGFRFWRADRPLYVLREGALRSLLARLRPIGAWVLDPPAQSGYLQLPRNLVWVPGEADETPEAVDGFFWTLAPVIGAAGSRLLLALVAGVRTGRSGFHVIAVEAPVPAEPVGHWGDVAGRADGPDFENILPGGELGGLFALTSVAEALRLASLVFHLAKSDAGTPGPPQAAQPQADPAPHAPAPSALPYRVIPGAADG
jgi:hypothetical protein